VRVDGGVGGLAQLHQTLLQLHAGHRLNILQKKRLIKLCVGRVDQASQAEGVVILSDCLPNSTFLYHNTRNNFVHTHSSLYQHTDKAHCISGSINVCGAAGVLGPVEGAGSVEVAVAVEESMVVVAGFLQREPKPSPMLGLPWLLYTLLFSLLLLSLLLIQNTESLVQEIHLFSSRAEARNAQHCVCGGECGSIPRSPCSLHEDQAG